MNILVSGACGRMGKRIINCAKNDPEIESVTGLESQAVEETTSEGVPVFKDPECIKDYSSVIEFTTPDATMDHLVYIAKHKTPYVIGVTGCNTTQIDAIIEISEQVPIVFAPNMSIGVNVMFRLLRDAAKILKKYNVYVEEAHHVHKKDSPSGTAKKIVQILNDAGMSVKDEDVAAIREGEIIGDHSVVFKSDLDEIEISHSAKTRDIFAQGAVVAAKWIVGKKPGIYSMEDVLFPSE